MRLFAVTALLSLALPAAAVPPQEPIYPTGPSDFSDWGEILAPGAAGAWDERLYRAGSSPYAFVEFDDKLFMYYQGGSCGDPPGVGPNDCSLDEGQDPTATLGMMIASVGVAS